jgi:putative DNA primase/helicase
MKNISNGMQRIENNLNSPGSSFNKSLNISEADVHPPFDEVLIEPDRLISHIRDLTAASEPTLHEKILISLLEQFEPLDFQSLAFPEAKKLKEELAKLDPRATVGKEEMKKLLSEFRVTRQHQLVLSIEHVLKVAQQNAWGICKNHEFIYLYNGAFWSNIEKETFQKFLGEAAEKMGVTWVLSRFYQFREQLFKQFLSAAFLPNPVPARDVVNVNLKNGTFEVTPTGVKLRPFDSADFLTYQLPFEYDPKATAPIFHKYLDRVIPEPQKQMILAEFLGYVFMKHGGRTAKEEKALILYGGGENGKSVFYEIVNALIGPNNVSSYSLQSLTNESGYFRAMLANRLVNYASEIDGNLNPAIFKQLCSGEPVEARLPYGQPFTLSQYAKLIFNCNKLPHDVEHTRAFFRRFLIVPFEVTIPEEEQDKELHVKIIDNELSGIFIWVLEGLHRLLKNKRFTPCDAVQKASEEYERQSDSVRLFVEDGGYEGSAHGYTLIKTLYREYREFCLEDGFKAVNKSNFITRLGRLKVSVEKKNVGNIAYLTRKEESF